MKNKFFSEISFFCPAYHDEENLPRLIPHVYKFLSEISNKFEIIIVEDGSPDRTGQVADELAGQYPEVRVIHHPKNMGYGAALRDGFVNARYAYVMYTDGDFQYDVTEFRPYLHLLESHDVLSGYASKKVVTLRRKIQSQVYNWLIAVLFFVWIKDIDCAMKIYKRKVLDSMEIKSASAFIDAEMLVKARKNGFKIAQFPVTQYTRKSGPEGGSKWPVIWTTVKDMIKFRVGLL
ncbi:MAG: glycosyltransferase family 2 protein [Candidatus Taylorbacteria bacterium]|nr:glycosyltransferase family 2 protein [Candidatus Taylorbacteria bacterium]